MEGGTSGQKFYCEDLTFREGTIFLWESGSRSSEEDDFPHLLEGSRCCRRREEPLSSRGKESCCRRRREAAVAREEPLSRRSRFFLVKENTKGPDFGRAPLCSFFRRKEITLLRPISGKLIFLWGIAKGGDHRQFLGDNSFVPRKGKCENKGVYFSFSKRKISFLLGYHSVRKGESFSPEGEPRIFGSEKRSKKLKFAK